MSGRHRVVKPRRRFGLAAVRVPVRALARWVRVGRDGMFRAWARLAERARERFERRDPFADVHLDPQATSPDPLPAPAPPEVEEPEPEPVALTPEQVLPTLHTQHPHLPVAHVLWHVGELGASGEVNALDADADESRRIVAMFADALAARVEEAPDGEHLTVYTAGHVGGVPVTVAAVLLYDVTMPLPAYREAAGCLSTQAIPDEVLREVMA